MSRALPFLAALALSACATVPSNGPVRTDSLARIGQATSVGRLVVMPQALVEDSRCPMNARCVWAGRAVVAVRIDGAGWRETVNLTLGEPRAIHGTSVALSMVRPEKMTGTTTAPGDYLFGFEGGH